MALCETIRGRTNLLISLLTAGFKVMVYGGWLQVVEVS